MLTEQRRPWKIATLVIGLSLLIFGSFYYQAPDWDIPVSFIMAGFTYLTAGWSMHVIAERHWRKWPLMILCSWRSVFITSLVEHHLPAHQES
jgi:hypothetical protein